MSVQTVERFIMDVRMDTSLEARISQVVGMDAFVQFANEEGYQFTERDMYAYLAQFDASLSEKELDNVTGGGSGAIDHFASSFRWGLRDETP